MPLGVAFTPIHPWQRPGGRADAHGAATARGSVASRDTLQPVSCCTEALFEGKVHTSEQFWRVQLEAIYLRRNPYKLHNVPTLMARYRGREISLYKKVCAAYDLNPTRFYDDPATWQQEGSGKGCGKDLVSAGDSEFDVEDKIEPAVEQVADEESADEYFEGMAGIETDEEDMEEQEETEAANCSMSDAIGTIAAGSGSPSVAAIAHVAGANQPVASPVRSSEQFWHVQLEAIYRRRNPQKLKTVPAMLKKYQGREALLYRKVCMMYDLDPAKFHAAVASSTGNESVVWQQEAGKRELHCSPSPMLSPRRHEPAAMVVATSPPTMTSQGCDEAPPTRGLHRASPCSEPQLSKPEVHRPISGPSSVSTVVLQPISQGLKAPAVTFHGCIAQPVGTPGIGRVESDAARTAREAGVAPSPIVRLVRQDGLGRPSWKPVPREARQHG